MKMTAEEAKGLTEKAHTKSDIPVDVLVEYILRGVKAAASKGRKQTVFYAKGSFNRVRDLKEDLTPEQKKALEELRKLGYAVEMKRQVEGESRTRDQLGHISYLEVSWA